MREFHPLSPALPGSFPGVNALHRTRRRHEDAELAHAARGYLRLRRLRDTLFATPMFADPAWDMLLDLFAAQIEGKAVSVSSACIAAAVPTSTALRWVSHLEEEGLVVRTTDPEDRRRAHLTITPPARTAIAQWLSALVEECAAD